MSTSLDELGTVRSEAKRYTRCLLRVGLLTGGDDKPYALGLAQALVGQSIILDFIGSDAVDGPELHGTPLINFLNLRGDQNTRAQLLEKISRIVIYYARLVHYAATSSAPVLHILWNNKFEIIDRVFLMLFYRLLGKKVVFTAHNVNAAQRDGKDSLLNRVTLRIQYMLTNHLLVHTKRMKEQLRSEFRVPDRKITVIPFGINNTIPKTGLTAVEARERLGISPGQKTALFFGQIAPYKGLEYLIDAIADLEKRNSAPRLIVAGKVKQGCQDYWRMIERKVEETGVSLVRQIGFIPDQEVEIYFKAADVVIIPYVQIFQSGVPFLAFSFGLPVIATDVGSLQEDILDGQTGWICRPKDPADLAEKIEHHFASDLYRCLCEKRDEIVTLANRKYSWSTVAHVTRGVYEQLLTGCAASS
ncbi:MAG: glycosyltransferase family 4 protein [Verrucomicrobia bacterium]|nr:glycosyltransferase family 4 protein [Verrucomicrobiota bacterium]MBV9672797.1 glycosyltransferase family 4 protein [Verrucomicrobiota bacterium]